MRPSNTTSTKWLLGTAALSPLFLAGTAFAHGGGDHVHGLFDGLAHPLLGVDHLLAAVAAGVLASRSTAVPVLKAAAFGGAVAFGLGLGLVFGGSPVEVLLAASVSLLGLLIASPRLGLGPAAASATIAFGLLHGHAHGVEMPASAEVGLYTSGIAFTTTAVAVSVALLATRFGAGSTLRDKATRAAGAILTAAGAALALA
ncbi:MAG: HupE/UreJ family protein [Myxococcales bacterium]|nr:HupE/UreJ family protein [Myxococcales bacterium]